MPIRQPCAAEDASSAMQRPLLFEAFRHCALGLISSGCTCKQNEVSVAHCIAIMINANEDTANKLMPPEINCQAE